MRVVVVTHDINAPMVKCFDLSRDIGFHVRSLSHTNERAIAGRTEGLIELGETVTWQARHLGMTRRMTVEITAMDRPSSFRDEQIDGPFKRFVHEHAFVSSRDGGTTTMHDRIAFESPYGWIGRFVDRFYLKRYLTRLITERNHALKAALEAGQTPGVSV